MAPQPETIDSLIASGERVTWTCFECKAWGEVDLARLQSARGDDFSLTDRHPPCRTPGCTYWVQFYAQHGMRTRRLSTREGDDRDGDRRTAWLKLKWAESKTPPA